MILRFLCQRRKYVIRYNVFIFVNDFFAEQNHVSFFLKNHKRTDFAADM